jgi:tetratricopeptide (TPR) repeat protein
VLDVLGEVLGLPPGNSLVANAGAQIRRQALIRDLRLALGALSERAPTVLVLEDLHWSDDASTQVLTEVLSDVPGLRLLVLAAHRPGWTAPWTDWGWTERLSLRPLRDEEATLLAGAVLGGMKLSLELERYVADRAGGNPFFVEEMLRALQETGGLEQRDGQMYLVPGAAERLPSTLTEVLLARLDRLEGQVRSLAQVASVIGRSFAVRLLAQVVGREAAALDMPLTALQRAEIAFPRRGSDLEYVFKHVSMREVAYNTLVQKRRQELHLATARAIAQLYPSDEFVEMIAYHFARTEEHAEAAEWLERAGDRAAAIYGNETAIENYQEARRRQERAAAESIVLARLDEKLGRVLSTMGRYDEALNTLGRSLEVYRRARDLEAAGRVMAQIGLAHRHRGTAQEGIAQLQPMLEMLTWSGPSPGLAALHIALSQLFFVSGRYHESLEAAERASELARAIGDDRLLADAEQRRGVGLIMIGQADEGSRALEGAIPLAEAVGDLNSLRLALGNLGEAYLRMGNLDAARRYIERSVEVTQRVGDPNLIAYMLQNLGEVLTDLGDWEGAQLTLDQAMEMVRLLGSSWYAAYPPLMLGQLRLYQGEWGEAARLLEEAVAIAGPREDRQALEYAQTWLAELDLLEGRPEAVLTRLEPLASDKDATLPRLLPYLALAQLELGEVDQAGAIAGEAVRLATEQHERLRLVDALRVQGMVLTRVGQSGEAAGILEEGLELARSLPFPYAEGRILYQLGLLDQERGQHQRAQQRLEEAQKVFQRLGARKDMERTELALVELATI